MTSNVMCQLGDSVVVKPMKLISSNVRWPLHNFEIDQDASQLLGVLDVCTVYLIKGYLCMFTLVVSCIIAIYSPLASAN